MEDNFEKAFVFDNLNPIFVVLTLRWDGYNNLKLINNSHKLVIVLFRSHVNTGYLVKYIVYYSHVNTGYLVKYKNNSVLGLDQN